MRTSHLVTSAALLLATFVLPPADAGACPDSNSGWGQESVGCEFACAPGDRVHVHVTVDDRGTVYGRAVCDIEYAECGGYDGSCHASSARLTRHADVGSCHGWGDGGWWTSVTIDCWSVHEGGCSTSGPALRDLCAVAAVDTGSAHLRIERGVATAFVCRGAACVEVAPVCATSGTLWSCRVGA